MLRNTVAVIALGLLTLPLGAQDAVSCKGMEDLLSEIRDLRALLQQSKPTAQRESLVLSAAIAVGDAPFLGSPEAPVTIVEFTDYQCPFCERFYKETFPNMKKLYIDTGKVRFYVMDLPLVEAHKNALTAAQAAHCAADQGQFWPMHDRMQSNPTALEIANLVGYAGDVGIDVAQFRKCIDDGRFQSKVQESASLAQSNGARGTPAFLVGRSTQDGVQGEFMIGAEPLGNFEKKIATFSK